MKTGTRRLIICAAVILTIYLSQIYWGSFLDDSSKFLSDIQNRYNLTYRRRTNVSKSNRSFLYLTQTESCLSEYLLGPGLFGNGSKSDIVVLSWKQPCSSKYSMDLKHITYIYNENTTWSKGRNILYQFANKLPNDYLYYIFMDDDLTFHFTNPSFAQQYRDLSIYWPLQAFEYFLLRYEPAIGLPMFCLTISSCEPVKSYIQPLPEYFPATIWFDAALNAFHKSAVHWLLPYKLDLEPVGWWHSQKHLILEADILFRGQILKFLFAKMVNSKHRKYPRKNWDNWADLYNALKATMPKMYRDQVNWIPRESIIDFKPIVKNNTVITPMYKFKMPLGKIEVEPFKHFKLHFRKNLTFYKNLSSAMNTSS